jgi:hypothetical protein
VLKHKTALVIVFRQRNQMGTATPKGVIFPALAFRADQKADAERDGETQDQGIVKNHWPWVRNKSKFSR